MPTDAERSAAVGTGLRIAVAAVICLYVGEYFEIDQTSLSVYTTFLVMALFPITSFQKGVERFVGRSLGLGYAYAVIWLAREDWLLYLALIVLGQMVACYIYLSGRLAYAALMGAIFIGVMAAFGATAPETAGPYAAAAVIQLLLGEAVAYYVNLVTGAESTLTLDLGSQPLFPLRWQWVNTAAMLSAAQVATMLATMFFDLPVSATMVSALVMGVVPGGVMEEGKKAWQRTLGAILGGGYALLCIVVLAYQPYLAILAALVAFILFAATYLTKTSKKNAYAYLQMGMVAPMVLIGSHGEIGTAEKAVQRVVGVGVALVASGLVALLWPHTLISQTAAPVPQIAHPNLTTSAS